MAWQYFTAPLAAGAILGREQITELYAAFDERLVAAGLPGDGLDWSALADVLASPYQPVQPYVAYTWQGNYITQELDWAIEEVAPQFERLSVPGSLWSDSTLRSYIANELGVTTAELAEAWKAFPRPALNNALLWNALREGIRALAHTQIFVTTAENTLVRSSGPQSSWASAVTAVLGAGWTPAVEGGVGPSSGATLASGGGTPWSILQTKLEGTVSIPSGPLWDSYDAWFYTNTNTSSQRINGVATLEFDGSTVSWTTVSESSAIRTRREFLARATNGTVAFSATMDSLTDSSALNALQPPSATSRFDGFSLGATVFGANGRLWLKPTFTHP